MAYRVPLAYNTMGDAELAAAKQVLDSGFVTQGERVKTFEREIAAYHGVKHAIFVNSGSSANLIAIEAAVYLAQLRPDLLLGRIERDDEVIIQGLNWPSTLTPLLNRGLKPVICDVDPVSLNASVETVAAARTDRTRMVVAVPVLGNPAHLGALRDYCAREGLLLLEDACESLGATVDGKPVGTFGLASAFSFYFSHHITTIEGGVVLTDHDELADICFALRAHGWSRNLNLEGFLDIDASGVDPRFCFVVPGYNVRSTELNAAIGSVQLARLDAMLDRRRAIAKARLAAVSHRADKIVLPGGDLVDSHSWMATPILFSDRAHRARGQAKLEELGVETRPIIVGNILRQPIARLLDLGENQPALPNCDEVFNRGVMIGLSPFSSDEDEALVHQALIAAADA